MISTDWTPFNGATLIVLNSTGPRRALALQKTQNRLRETIGRIAPNQLLRSHRTRSGTDAAGQLVRMVRTGGDG
jgi:hypothetical protein